MRRVERNRGLGARVRKSTVIQEQLVDKPPPVRGVLLGNGDGTFNQP